MSKLTTDRVVNAIQLAAELGAGVTVRDYGDTREIEVEGVGVGPLTTAVTAHVADQDYGRPVEEVQLSGRRAKAAQVIAGNATFTANEIQLLLAAIILRGGR